MVGRGAAPMGQLHPVELGGHQSWEARGSQIGAHPRATEMPREEGGGTETLRDVAATVREVMSPF